MRKLLRTDDVQKIILSLKKLGQALSSVLDYNSHEPLPLAGRIPAMFSATLRCQVGVEKNDSPAALGYAGINLLGFKTISSITTV